MSSFRVSLLGGHPRSPGARTRVLVPAVWAAAEAAWMCLLWRAVVNTGDTVRMPLSYLAFALGGATAAGAAAWTGERGWPWWQRALVFAPVAAAGVMATAGGLAAGWSGALAPWDLPSKVKSAAVGGGWLLAIIVWARGTSIGWPEPKALHATRSAVIGSIVILALLLGRAVDDPVFDRATPGVGWLFAVFAVGMAVTVALVRERELEQRILMRPPGGTPGLSWFGLLGGPMLVVAAAAFVLAVAAGPVGKPVAGAGKGGTEAVADVIRSGWRKVDQLFDTKPPANPTVTTLAETDKAPPRIPSGPLLSVTQFFLVLFFLAVVGLGGAWLLAMAGAVELPGFLGSLPGAKGRFATDEEENLFEAKTFFGRFLARLRRFFRDRRRRRAGRGAGVAASAESGVPLGPPVRQEYLEVLTAARRRGAGRVQSETVEEFEARLHERLDPRSREDLRALGELYTGVRYGEQPAGEGEATTARAACDVVVAALESSAPDAEGGRRAVDRPG